MDTLKITRPQPDLGWSGYSTARTLWAHAVARDTHMIGWLPYQAFEDAASRGHVINLYRNDDLVGFALWSTNLHNEIRCIQIWVRPDARMIEHGRAIVRWLERTGASNNCWRLRLWCGEDLAANIFWRALDFENIAWRHGRTDGGRRHLLWVRRISQSADHPSPSEPELRSHPELEQSLDQARARDREAVPHG